jgi:predicted ArsR family transcriptional regulator
MHGLTIKEIAEALNITPEAAKFRLLRNGIQPKDHAGKTNIYDETVVEQIRMTSKGGRPKKKKG